MASANNYICKFPFLQQNVSAPGALFQVNRGPNVSWLCGVLSSPGTRSQPSLYVAFGRYGGVCVSGGGGVCEGFMFNFLL